MTRTRTKAKTKILALGLIRDNHRKSPFWLLEQSPEDESRGLLSFPDVDVPILSNRVTAPEVDVEVKGFSLAAIVSFWGLVREHQYSLAGDLICSQGRVWIRARIVAGAYWQTPADDYEQFCEGCREIAHKIMEWICPPVMGAFYVAQGDREKAMTLYRSWTLREPDNFQAHFFLGARLLQDVSEKETDETTGLELSDDVIDKASTCFRIANRLNPNSPEVLLGLGVVMEGKGNQPNVSAEERHAAFLKAEIAHRKAIRIRF